MTEDNVTSGQAQINVRTGEPVDPLTLHLHQSVVASLPTGGDGAPEPAS